MADDRAAKTLPRRRESFLAFVRRRLSRGIERQVALPWIDEAHVAPEPDAAQTEGLAHADLVTAAVRQLQRREEHAQLQRGQVLESHSPPKRHARAHWPDDRVLGIVLGGR